jgi:hypothetical protein
MELPMFNLYSLEYSYGTYHTVLYGSYETREEAEQAKRKAQHGKQRGWMISKGEPAPRPDYQPLNIAAL